MPIQKTIETPASHRITLDIPGEVPQGRTILTFTPAPAAMTPADEAQLLPSYTLEEAIAEADRRAEAAEADPSLYSLKASHGVLKDSKAWGQEVNAAAEIRKMRDEWPDYWNGGNGKT